MKGQPSACAKRRPSVDLPAPRSPTSAIRRARSLASILPARLSISSATAGSSDGGRRPSMSRMWVIAAVRPLLRGSSSMIGTSSASAIDFRMITDGLPCPLSICAR